MVHLVKKLDYTEMKLIKEAQMKNIFSNIALLLFFSCASKQVMINSNPPGADVYNGQDKIGTTPLNLDSEKLKRMTESGVIEIALRKDGFNEKIFIFKPEGIETYNLNMNSLVEMQTQMLPSQYRGTISAITRDLLTIQGLIFSKKLPEAKQKLTLFQEKYPFIAASFVLSSSIALLNSDLKSAYLDLVKAQTLDQSDPQIKKMLNEVALKIQDKKNE